MVKYLVITFAVLVVTLNAKSQTELWTELESRQSISGLKKVYLDTPQLAQRFASGGDVRIHLPTPDGQFNEFHLTPYFVMSKELASKYPEIKTYTGVQVGNPAVKGTFDFSPSGFFGVYELSGKRVFIEPINGQSQQKQALYRVYNKYALDSQSTKSDYLLHEPIKRKAGAHTQSRLSDTRQLRFGITQDVKYRLAVVTTGEYAQFHGGTKSGVMAALVTLVNRVNQVYMQDLSTSFELVANNDDLIFLDPATDPFANDDTDIDKIADAIASVTSVDSYDIGHLVGTGAGGLAGFGVACTSAKAEGVTGNPQPVNDAFAIDYVAHELGHQLGADHTFNGLVGACDGNRVEDAAFEPGSGSTIMGYTGICDTQNLQANSDPYFHVYSLEQMAAYTRQADGSSCGIRTAKTNQAPVVEAGENFTIPARTPFILSGSATDADGDALMYSWQQSDLGGATNSPQEDATDMGSGPLFRVFNPVPEGERTFPKMEDVLSGQVSYGEVLPTTSRSLNFKLLVRDGAGNIADDAMIVTVVGNQQGFAVQDPTSGTLWMLGTQTVRWETAGTENAPISCGTVDILLSLDGGETFPTVIGDNVANDGEHEVTLAGLVSSVDGKLKIKCTDNIFFAVNNGNVQIQGSSEPIAPNITEQENLTVAEDTNITLEISNFKYEGGFNAESITVGNGDNYTVSGLTVTPTANFNGTLNVPITAVRGELTSDTFNASISVTAVNDAPSGQDDTFSVTVNTQNNLLNVLANDIDVDGDNLVIGTVNYQGTGSVIVSNNQLSYTPATDFLGSEQLSYVVRDAAGVEATAQVTITVAAAPSNDGGGSSGQMYYLSWLMLLLTLIRARQRRAI
ncbi:reprolysin-like metallopeptidase [Pseudoalteromonas luteoviolacea]|nr:zinc-dependent metalloprotease family protein [Pseudoalteromonas luteoviolacea]MBQ4878105.1 cadherin-like domain-containing protein [Pseudoalteromonas luteoviolacea]MBQ4907041.1 cadherin-like domain-containing protein [Pseudoalteromonas luteoviolacea]